MCLWGELPIGRVVRLVGASPAALALTLVPLPAEAPAVVIYRPSPLDSAGDVAAGALDELEGAALGLFPAWLPDATGIRGIGGAAIAAVRTLAMRAAPTTAQFGPFLADLAERALRHRQSGSGRFSPEVRAAGLARVIGRSYDRSAAALLIEVPANLTSGQEHALVAACEWLAHRGGLGVWLTGAQLSTVDWISGRKVRLPEPAASIARTAPTAPPTVRPAQPVITYPPLAGRPHPASRAERAVERALARQPWAAGRTWNQTYQAKALEPPVRLDLLWLAERCVVELDGPEHLEPLRYESDRRRDRLLQQNGFAVARFTNAQIAQDLAAVVSQIEQLVTARRRAVAEG
jgi:very-short-patch-repair endonuclease